MSASQLQAVSSEETITLQPEPNRQENKISLFKSLKNFALAGSAGFFLLTIIEQIDLNFKLTPVLWSLTDRLVLAAYSSISIAAGIIIGLIAGLAVYLFSITKSYVEKALSKIPMFTSLHSIAAGLFVAGVAAILLNQYPRINSYIIGLIRELEKFRALRDSLLNHERSTSYLMIMGMVVSIAVIVMVVRRSSSLIGWLKAAWIIALTLSLAVVYYFDSRVEVQLYEYTWHRSLYLAAITLAMALAATLFTSSPRINQWWSAPKSSRSRAIISGLIVIFIASLVFTFFHFGRDQNLKTQIFYRSTQAKQNFKLAWYALDFDRDGYSAMLDGGDADDFNQAINPGALEKPDDGIDNNSIAGDLTSSDIDDWRAEHNAMRPPISQDLRRFNVIYFFIDTVRADHLSTYGYQRNTTPNIDRLAERSTLFENGFSPAARTSEAIPRFMQSNYWDGHLESWPEVLTRNGYNTLLFPGRRSWERYREMMKVVKGAQGKPLQQNIDFVIETLSQTPLDRPFCAYVYVPDPHQPYIKHDAFNYGDSRTDLYDGELAYTDFHLGRLFDWMEQTGRMQDTMIVIMSDHGESLGERDVYRHATQLYNEQTQVPMLVYVPTIAPRRVKDYVSTIDLGATILDANGIESPKDYLGLSLMSLMRGEAFTRPPVYGEQTSQEISAFVRLDQQVHPETKKYMAIDRDGFKLIYNRDFNCFEMYDLKNDPREERNLFDRLPEKAARMKQLVGRYVDILTALRPWDADEGRYSRASGADGDKVED